MRRKFTEAEKRKQLSEALATFRSIDKTEPKPTRPHLAAAKRYAVHEAVQTFHATVRRMEAEDGSGYEKAPNKSGYAVDQSDVKASRNHNDWGDTSGAVNVSSGRLDEDEALGSSGHFSTDEGEAHAILKSAGFVRQDEDEDEAIEDEGETQYSHPAGHSAAVQGGKTMVVTAEGKKSVYHDAESLAEGVKRLSTKAAESAFWSRYYGLRD